MTINFNQTIKSIDALGKDFCKELEEFFVNYHRLSDKEYRVLGVKGGSGTKTGEIREAMRQLIIRFVVVGL